MESSIWKTWEGHRIAGRFPLLRLLGASPRSAVFLTERSPEAGAHPEKAAIKLFPSSSYGVVHGLVNRWEKASRLSHPNLLPIYEAGTDTMGDSQVAYTVMEAADDDLSQLDRPLSEPEARDLIAGLLPVLVHLRQLGLSHGHIQPSNILAAGDRLFMSSDSIRPIAEWNRDLDTAGAFAAPEILDTGATPASDMWSLGASLKHVLGEIPGALREPIEQCLLSDLRQRATDGDLDYMMRVSAIAPPPRRAAVPPRAFLWTGGVAAIALAATLYLANSGTQTDTAPTETETSAAESASPAVSEPLPAEMPERQATEKEALLPPALPPPASPSALKTGPDAAGKQEAKTQNKGDLPKRESPAATTPPVQSKAADRASSKTTSPPPERPEKASPQKTSQQADAKTGPATAKISEPAARAGQQIVRQVLPDVPAPARRTIRGRVVIRVRAFVDSSGKVISTTNQSPNASAYFGKMAVEAAQQWQFAPPPPDGPQSNAWTLEFEFRNNAARPVTVKATPALR